MDNVFGWMVRLIDNEIFNGLTGVIGLIILAFLLYFTLKWLIRQFSVSCEISSSDAYSWFSSWLTLSKGMAKRRRIVIYESNSRGNNHFCLSVPLGVYLFWFGWRPFLVWYNIDQRSSTIDSKKYRYLIYTLGRSQDTIKKIMEECRSSVFLSGFVPVYVWDGYWHNALKRPSRSWDSVILNGDLKEEIDRDINNFLGREEWYTDRGVPYRRAYLFSGKPGCGKSSLVMSLASRLDLPIYILNIGSVKNDRELGWAFSGCGNKGILLIEDIDATHSIRGKQENESAGFRPKDDGISSKETKGDDDKQITLSSLLNCLDGLLTPHGQIICLTTNFYNHLDFAMIRPGRVDRHFEIDPLGYEEAQIFFKRFYPDSDLEVFLPKGSVVPSYLQQVFMAYPDDPKRAIEEIKLNEK